MRERYAVFGDGPVAGDVLVVPVLWKRINVPVMVAWHVRIYEYQLVMVMDAGQRGVYAMVDRMVEGEE